LRAVQAEKKKRSNFFSDGDGVHRDTKQYNSNKKCKSILSKEANKMIVRTKALDAELFLKFFNSVGWTAPCKAQVDKALNNSFATFVAYEEEQPVGMVRLLGDGGMSFYIKDFVVVPKAQGKGVGRLLMETTEKYIRDTIPGDWAVSLELISTIEAQKFYEKMGFEARPCEWDGPGMFKMLR
jgi:GNAT superfamily N-acetyltransferase